MILVTGATGNVGREVVRQLQQAGRRVRVLTRSPEKVAFSENIEIVVGDLTALETLKAALEGVHKVFLILVPGSDQFPTFAKQSGVGEIVFLSSGAIDSPTENAIGRNHLHTEELIRQSGVKWVFLRPAAFMTNALQWAVSIRSEGVIRAPFGDVGDAPIDPRDIAAVAAAALVSPEHEGKVYTLTGPEILTPIEQVQILGSVLGRDLRFEDIPEKIAEENMKRFAPPEIVESIFSLARERRDNKNHADFFTTTVADVTGRPAHTFRQWATDYAGLFR
jgi:uncharacterized protein YbjT (DUF2867 family)